MTENINAPVVQESSQITASTLIMQGATFDRVMMLAEHMAKGKMMVPEHFRGNPADCSAIIMQALQWGMNPYTVAQKTHIVSGKLGYEAQLVNAVLQSTGAIHGRFHYEYRGEGENMSCRVAAIPAGESELVWGEWLTLNQITVRNSPLWKTNQRQQIGYLQVKNWGRAFAPGALLGVYTPDELEEIPSEREINTAPSPEKQPAPEVKTVVYYPEEPFLKSFPKWKIAVETGKSNTETWVATLEAKYPLTDDQKNRINEIKAPIQGEVVTDANTQS